MLEAAFLIVLAVAAGLAELSPTTIVLVMAGAWLLVAAIEWLAWRESPVFSRRVRAERPPVAPPEAVPSDRRRGWRFWRRDPNSSAPAETVTAAQPKQPAPAGEDTEDLGPPAEQPAQVPVDERTGT
jgi:hypothetical protein